MFLLKYHLQVINNESMWKFEILDTDLINPEEQGEKCTKDKYLHTVKLRHFILDTKSEI